MSLPTCILVQAKDPPGTQRRFVLLGTHLETFREFNTMEYTVFTLFENPLQMLQGFGRVVWKADAIEEQAFPLRICRKSRTKPNLRFYEVMVTKTSEYIQTTIGNFFVYTMTQRHTVLPDGLSRVSRNEDPQQKYHFLAYQIPLTQVTQVPQTQRAPAPSAPSVAGVPRHVLEGFIESQIAQRQTCPITLEPFTKERTAYAKCGHLFDKDAIRQEIRRSGQCPTCRCRLRLEELQCL